jgi:2-keto-4-pentenoate hydratase/2-oxohepta-3-ene-1,7-dioic acid hydratase in catechol pathway
VILEAGSTASADVAGTAVGLGDGDDPTVVMPLDDVALGPPIPDPDKIILLGLNYADHIAETGHERGEFPPVFPKFRTALRGCAEDVVLPVNSSEVDYEGELAVVIGHEARHVDREDVPAVIAGYMVLNDLSARDLQYLTTQFLIGKALDGFAPCGPAVVSPDEIGDPQDLQLTTWVNGEVRQSASTAQMMWSVAESIAFLSRITTLVPGDIISTGTPSGVGMARTPPTFLHDGDVVEVEIEGLGRLANRMVAPR